MLSSALGQFHDLQIVPEERLTAALRRASLALDVALDGDQLRRIAEETGGWTAVSGTVLASGGKLRVSVQALDVATTKILTRVEGEIPADGDVRPAFDTLATRLLAVAGVSPTGAVDLGALTTRSVDAYREYVKGLDALRHADGVGATAAFAEAVKLDSTFTLAWARLGLATVLWDTRAMLDPRSIAYRAVERATRSGAQLPPHEARELRALQATFLGRMSTARAILDSALTADPADIDAREYLGVTEMRDAVIVDTLARQPRLQGSLNRAVRLLTEVLQRDPGRLSAYSWLTSIYLNIAGGTAGQPWWPALKREAAWFTAALNPSTVAPIIPVLRDSIEFMAPLEWLALPNAERRRMQARAVDVGRGWTERWISSAPNDAFAHFTQAMFAGLAGDNAGALREFLLAPTAKLPVDVSVVPSIRELRLLGAGRLSDAAQVADSMRAQPNLAAGSLEFHARTLGVVRLLQKQWPKAWQLLDSIARAVPPASRCGAITAYIAQDWQWALPAALRVAIMDTVAAHFMEVLRTPGLGACAAGLAGALAADSVGLQRPVAARQILALVDSLEAIPGTSGDAPLLRAASLYSGLDSVGAGKLASYPHLVRVAKDAAIMTRFEAAGFVVSGDSVDVSWKWIGAERTRWDVPGAFIGWSLRARVAVVQDGGRDTTFAVFAGDHSPSIGAVEPSGGPTEIAAAMDQRGAIVSRVLPGMRALPISPTMVRYGATARVTDGLLHLVVHGDIADALRRAHPETAQFGLVPCRVLTGGLCGWPTVKIQYLP